MSLREWLEHDPEPRSQKARGLLRLRDESGVGHLYGGRTPDFTLAQSDADIEQVIARWLDKSGAEDCDTTTIPLFCRPCPVRPRHGFVDSGPIKTPEELKELWAQTIKADPQAEMLIMNPIEASCSAIYTPTSISFGPSNDGATAGADSHIMFHSEPTPGHLDKIAEGKGIAEGEVPYVEVVYDDNYNPNVVQVRSGPAISAEPDFIPAVTYPNHIVQPSGEDLIEWEQMAADWEEGTVIYHPGGNRASHYAIHCVNNNIPYITTFEPVLGRRLEPTAPIAEIDVEAFRLGIMTGTHLDIPFAKSVELMLFGLHTSALNSTPTSWKIVGMGAMQCLRLGAAACLGEFRHHQRSKKLARRQIFENAFEDFFGHQKKMVKAYRSFSRSRWRSGYGGPKWAECAHQNMFLWLEILEFMKEPTKKRARHILDAYNRAVNVAHNGGWLFNKFASGDLMDQAAAGNPSFFIRAVPTIFRCVGLSRFEPGWTRMRRPRVLHIQNVDDVRSLVHNDEAHNRTGDPNHVPKPKPTGIKAVQGIMRENILHLQIKLHGKSGYITRDIPIAASQVPQVQSLHKGAVSWATDKPYTQFLFQDTIDSKGPVLTDWHGLTVIKPDTHAMGISVASLNICIV